MNVPKHSPRVSEYPVWLAVPHEAREAVREAAGQLENGRSAIAWDREASLWFARPGCDLNRVSEWLPDPSRRAGGGDPETQFLDALTQAGLVIRGMPIMDGQRHRVATVEDKHGKQSGVYRGFLDRRPGGWFINYHRAVSDKEVTNWAATGGESDPATRLHIRAGARQAQDDAVRSRAETHAAKTLAAKSLYDRLPAVDPAHPYLVRKGITPTPELRETRNGALVVPFFNTAGEFRTLQYIPPEGEKFLFKDAPKQGNYLVVGGALEPGQPVLYAEGYATARSLNMATGNPVVMTIDAGNMLAVAKVLHERFPDNPHVFMADFDHAKDENKGLLMATAAAELVGGQVHYPTFTDAEKAQGFTDYNDLHQTRGLEALRGQFPPELIRDYEAPTMQQNPNAKDTSNPQPVAAKPVDQAQTSVEQALALTPAVRRTLEKEWDTLQRDFLKQQDKMVGDLKGDLRDAFKAEKANLKSEIKDHSKRFGELVAPEGQKDVRHNELQIFHLNHALRQLNKPVNADDTSTFDGQRAKLLEAGRYSIERGKANPSAVGELAKDRDTWVREQALARVGPAGLEPLKTANPEGASADFEAIRKVRVAEIVSVAKDLPFQTAGMASMAMRSNVEDHSMVSAQRFGAVEQKAAAAIDARAEAYVDATSPSSKVGDAPVVIAPEAMREWARLDTKDFGAIQSDALQVHASEVMTENTKAAPVYAQEVETVRAQQISTPIPDQAVMPEPRNDMRAAEPSVSVAKDQVAETALPAQPAPVVEQQASLAVEAAPSVAVAQPMVPGPVAEPMPSEAGSATPVLGNAPPPIASVETAPIAQPANSGSEASLAIADPVAVPAAQPASTVTQSLDTSPEFVRFDAKPDASTATGPAVTAPANAPPPIGSVETAPAAQPASSGREASLAIADPVQTPTAPAMPAAAAVADKAVADETPAAPQPTKAQTATAKEEKPAPVTKEAEPAFLPKKVIEDLSANAEPDAIVLGPPRPRGGEVEPQASNIDKDSLLARVSHEIQNDREVLYKLDGQAAFVDLGSRLEMANGASKNDEMVVAALLTAAQYYRGRIELTGSDAFKEKAIGLIAQHQINVEMKNPAQQAMLQAAREAVNTAPEARDAVKGDMTPAQRAPEPSQAPIPQTASPQPAQSASQVLNQPPQQAPVSASYQPVEVPDIAQPARQPAAQQPVDVPATANQPVAPVGPGNQVHYSPATQPVPASAPDTAQQAPASPRISPAIHQPFQAAKEGVTGKVLDSGQAPFRFEKENAESTFIKLRTKAGVETFWGKELAGMLRDTRVQKGSMVTLQWLGKEQVKVNAPVKDEHGVTVRYEDKQAYRNQWSLQVAGNPAVRTGQDEGVQMRAYDAGRFATVQNALVAQLGVEVPTLSPPKEGLYWLTPKGQGSAKAGDELSAPRPPVDPKNTAGTPVISSWTQDGQLDTYLVRGDGPYLQGVARQGNQYQHVLVSLPGRDDAPPMVFNAITPEGLAPIGTGNAINRSGGQSVARENIAFKLEGDSAVRIGKLDAPADVPPMLHARLGFDERWKEDNALPKSAPTPAPSAQPSEPRPV